MPKVTVRGSGLKVDLNKGNFIAKGGEGSIYIVKDVVYKHTEAAHMIPDGKFTELAQLKHKAIIVPEDVLLDKNKKPCGYTMRAVPNKPIPLAQILTKGYRQREGVTPDHMMELVKQMMDGLRYIHSQPGYFQVDGNELNYMVTGNYNEVYFIDTNSYQTPHYPADAIMLSIRDWSVQQQGNAWQWSELSDAWSFGIISFYMFCAIHPFKGRHPHCTDVKTLMVENMKHHKSVLDPETKFPTGPIYHPFEDMIPGGKDGAFMQWYRAMFIEGKRLPIPPDFQAVIAFVAKVKEVIGTNNFSIEEIKKCAAMITGYYDNAGKNVTVTQDQVYVGNSIKPKPADKFRVGFTPTLNIPVAVWIEGETVKIQNLESQTMIRSEIAGKSLMACEGRIYIQSHADIYEIVYVEQSASSIIASARSIAGVMPNATSMFQGAVIQDMFGTTMVSVFPEVGHHRQMPIPELNDFRVTEAKYEGNVLMVVGINKAEGHYNRFVFRFAKDWGSYDCRIIENIAPAGLNFTVTDAGICVCITEDDNVEIFSNRKDSASVKSIDDPDIKADMRLCHSGAQVRIAYGDKLHNFSMK
jgi:hypothetical protein